MTTHSYMGIKACSQESTLCIGSDDEGEGDADEGTTTTAAAPAQALVTLSSFIYGNHLSDKKIDKAEKVNRYLADHNFFLTLGASSEYSEMASPIYTRDA